MKNEWLYGVYLIESRGSSNCFTDTSKVQTEIGCAFVVDNTHKRHFCFSLSSVCTVELEAINRPIMFTTEKIIKNFLYSRIQKVTYKLRTFYPHKINQSIFENSLDIKCFWVLSHIGITGNEAVDTMAKSAFQQGYKINTLVIAEDLYRSIFQKRHDEWTTTTNNEPSEIRPDIAGVQ